MNDAMTWAGAAIVWLALWAAREVVFLWWCKRRRR